MTMAEKQAKPTILAIDIGSSSVRCSAYFWSLGDGLTCLVASTKKLRAVHPVSGKVSSKIYDLVDACVDETISQLKDHAEGPFKIVAVGFSSFVMNLVGVGEEGELLGEEVTLSYSCNTDVVSDEIRSLKSELGEDRLQEIYLRTGAPVHSAYALAQLRVLYSNNASACEMVQKWQTVASICLATWTHQNHLPISYSEASWTGLLNYQSCEYDESVLDLLPEDCCNALPDLADFDEPYVLREGIPKSSSYYQRWPELRNTRFYLGLGDGACANIGSKCTIPTRISCTVGTSAAARVVLPLAIGATLPAFEPGLFCYRIDKAHVLLGGSMTDGGSVIEWVKQLLNLESPEAFDSLLADVEALIEEEWDGPISRTRPTFVPFLSGERSTGFRSGATAAMIGLTRSTTPAHFAKACIEGVTLQLGAIVKLIRKSIVSETSPRLIASGKALEQNSLWRQALSDCTGLHVIADHETLEATSRGVACMVAMSLGLRTEPAEQGLDLEIIQLSKVSKPRMQASAFWGRAARVQEDLINAVSPMYENR